MWALVGLLAGALAGHALWGFWGATAVGLIGFFSNLAIALAAALILWWGVRAVAVLAARH